jgi:hypothetical protein
MGLEYLQGLLDGFGAAGGRFDYGCDDTELAYLARLADRPTVQVVGETGFNAGFSAWVFLQASPATRVHSFDLGMYGYTQRAKQHIDEAFTGRHELIRGDSQETLPAFSRQHPGLTFDLIFIDGGHTYEVALADLRNMRAMANAGTIVVIDDITPWRPCGVGPTAAWLQSLREGLVVQDELVKEGEPVATLEPPGNRVWAVGRYQM